MLRGKDLITGQIYWVEKCPPIDGDNEKGRPVVVFSSRDELDANPAVILVVPISCSNRDKDRVPIPNLAIDPRQQLTDLNRECWAIPRRVFAINIGLLGDLRGFIKAGRLSQLQLAVVKRAEESEG